MSPRYDLCEIGNFDTQGGWRVLYRVLEHLRETIEYYVIDLEQGRPYVEEHDQFVAALDLFAVTVEYCGIGIGVKPELVRHWRDVFMPAFDEEFGPTAERVPGIWEEERRVVILDVFAHLEQVVGRLYPKDEEPK